MQITPEMVNRAWFAYCSYPRVRGERGQHILAMKAALDAALNQRMKTAEETARERWGLNNADHR